MAFLRAFSDIDVIHTNKIPIKEGKQYKVAKDLFDKDNSIMYFYYFDDNAEQNNRFYNYPITKDSIEICTQFNMW
jgi:hypothetical protein